MRNPYINISAFIYCFNSTQKPAVRCKLPSTFIVETEHCQNMQTKNTSGMLDYNIIKACAKPVYFEGALPGDVLEVSIDRILCHFPEESAATSNQTAFGNLTKVSSANRCDLNENYISETKDNFKIQMLPMMNALSSIAVGETAKEMPSCYSDCSDVILLKEGSIIYIPVEADGGLLSFGSLHTATSALETDGAIELTVTLRKDLKLNTPFAKIDDMVISIVSADTVEAALHDSMEKYIDFITSNGNMDYDNAAILCALFGNLKISPLEEDPHRTAILSLALGVLEYAGITL